ncbi:reverse transcriptase domain-containing protein [Tanacetum coccineum]
MFKYGETQSEAVKLLILPLSLYDKAKTWFDELTEESITSWEQMKRIFINRFFPPSLFNHLLLEIKNFTQNVRESLTDIWLRLKNMLRKCHGHGLTKGAIIQIFYHGLDESTQGILDVTAGGIFLYKSPNQAFQFLDYKVLFKLNWSTKSKNEHHQRSVAFVDGSNNNDDIYRLMEKLEALTIKMDSHFQRLKEEMHEMRNNYNNRGCDHASKNDDAPMCEHHEVNYIQSEGYQNQNSHDSYFRQSHHDLNDSEKSLTELNRDVKNDLKDFKSCVRSMRTVHDKLFDRDDQSKTDFKKSITKFLDGQRVASMYIKNNVNDIIIKMKQNEKNFQTKIKNMERKLDEWSKSQNVSLEQINRTKPPPPPQAQTEHVNAIFIRNGMSDDPSKILKDPPPPIIVNNKIKKYRPIKTSKKGYHVVKIKEYPLR